jgi:hydroxyethylthiazole kinase-like uncharacterized protein yjeF
VQKIVSGVEHTLYAVDQTRQIEQQAAASLAPNTLMQRAGLAIAKLALAIAPSAERIWLACGPGNNGGDGLEAALHLQRWGKQTFITWLGQPTLAPPDSAAACQRVMLAGIPIESEPTGSFDLCIDAMLGIGTQLREPQNKMADWITRINSLGVPVLSVDVPTGLNSDTGQVTALHVKASHTLSLLTLKPGLFTAFGRDAAGTIWLDDLGIQVNNMQFIDCTARLNSKPRIQPRPHASHKGSFGDVAVVAGAPGMSGAALLAACAALHAGAGRVFVSLLDGGSLTVDPQLPELMFRPIDTLDFSVMTVVVGCGGGEAVRAVLPKALSTAAQLVMDADALNTVAAVSSLQALLINRSARGVPTILTPHPLEAARLLTMSTSQVQNDRLAAARQIAQQYDCTVVLKGSGTVIAAAGHTPAINPTGNARLSSAGTGDVLAGMIGAALAAGLKPFDAACQAVYRHGELADHWPVNTPLSAGQLARQTTWHR